MTRFLAAALLCALFVTPASAPNFLERVVSINVTMTKEESCIASTGSETATRLVSCLGGFSFGRRRGTFVAGAG